jgi:hypothetical protein
LRHADDGAAAFEVSVERLLMRWKCGMGCDNLRAKWVGSTSSTLSIWQSSGTWIGLLKEREAANM